MLFLLVQSADRKSSSGAASLQELIFSSETQPVEFRELSGRGDAAPQVLPCVTNLNSNSCQRVAAPLLAEKTGRPVEHVRRPENTSERRASAVGSLRLLTSDQLFDLQFVFSTSHSGSTTKFNSAIRFRVSIHHSHQMRALWSL